MFRTFIGALLGATAIGVVSAQAMTVDSTDVSRIVSEKAATLPGGQQNIDGISVLTDWDGDGHTRGYTAWVALKSGGAVVYDLDDDGTVERVYTRGPAHLDGVMRF